jgi:phosphatidylserine/phosphatidylglycerophosphate/cardiolipin synthase-like enzyme
LKALEDWLAHLESLHPRGQAGIELGLERIRQVKAVLGQQQHCPVIIVGGTNGKGSTCAYLENIIDRAGYKVGCYTSPHLLAYNERVRLNGRPVGDEALCAVFARVEAARHQAGNVALTYFEFGTLAAWEVFAEAGVEVVRFVPPFRSPKRGRTNLRNHRKMLIADGLHLWCGGRNLAAEYFEGDLRPILGRMPWVDLSFDLCGQIAGQALQQFEEDWAFAVEQPVPDSASLQSTASASGALAQLVASGPDRPDDTIYTLLVSSCFTSQKRILAVTPYFIPDTALLTALMLAARRGIEIDLVLPARSNHRLADFARHRLLRDLVTAGGRVWMHPRMIHAKAVVIDDELALAGSANLDGRSLFLNYEMMVAFYDRKGVRGFARWVETRRQEAQPYVARSPGMLRELAEGLLLWLAFQL